MKRKLEDERNQRERNRLKQRGEGGVERYRHEDGRWKEWGREYIRKDQ